VEYRLTPEFVDPVPVEDCYAGLERFAGIADVFDVDPRQVLIGGPSAVGPQHLGRRCSRVIVVGDAGSDAAHVADARRSQRDSAQQIDGVGDLGSHQ